jgi:hypothetical protein
MATIRISFDGGNVPIVTGDMPANEQTPMAEPTSTGYTTNQLFIVVEGMYCFALQTTQPHTPLWHVVQAVDSEQTDIAFRILS